MILEGDQVRLRPATREDLPVYTRWFTDPEFRRFMGSGNDVMGAIVSQPADQDSFSVEAKDGRLIGFVFITRIRGVNRNCELGSVAIGEEPDRGKGIGTDMVLAALRYCFRELNMHTVYIRTVEYNERARTCYERIFPNQVRLRERDWIEGRFWDQVLFDITEEEFDARERA